MVEVENGGKTVKYVRRLRAPHASPINHISRLRNNCRRSFSQK